jgi:MscS family membrane protein
MSYIDSAALRDWLLAVCALVAAIVAAGATRVFLRSRRLRRWEPLLRELAPPISYFVMVLGLRAFADFAPLSESLRPWVQDGIYVLGAVIVTFVIHRALMLAVEWGAQRSPRSLLLQHGFIPLLKNVITIFVFFTATIFVLRRFGQDVLSLLTALGVGSLAVGLAAKDTLANMIAGFTLIIDRNLKPGDRINLAGATGEVDEIGLRSTRIRTGDGNILIVPNSELVNTKILNLSMPTIETSCTTEIRVPYWASFQDIRKICLQALEETPRVSKARGRSVLLKSLAEGHQIIQIAFWVEDASESGGVLSQVHETILGRLQDARIGLIHPAHAAQPSPPA